MAKEKILDRLRVRYSEHVIEDVPGRTPCVVIRLKITEGPKVGQSRTYYGYLSEKSIVHTVAAMRALGMINDDITHPLGLGGTEAEAVETENLFKNADGTPSKYKTRISWINPLGLGKGMAPDSRLKDRSPVAKGNVASFASRYKAAFRAQPADPVNPSSDIPGDPDPSAPF